jgi:hypothetical protein
MERKASSSPAGSGWSALTVMSRPLAATSAGLGGAIDGGEARIIPDHRRAQAGEFVGVEHHGVHDLAECGCIPAEDGLRAIPEGLSGEIELAVAADGHAGAAGAGQRSWLFGLTSLSVQS